MSFCITNPWLPFKFINGDNNDAGDDDDDANEYGYSMIIMRSNWHQKVTLQWEKKSVG